jgi:hypothetical protein
MRSSGCRNLFTAVLVDLCPYLKIFSSCTGHIITATPPESRFIDVDESASCSRHFWVKCPYRQAGRLLVYILSIDKSDFSTAACRFGGFTGALTGAFSSLKAFIRFHNETPL